MPLICRNVPGQKLRFASTAYDYRFAQLTTRFSLTTFYCVLLLTIYIMAADD